MAQQFLCPLSIECNKKVLEVFGVFASSVTEPTSDRQTVDSAVKSRDIVFSIVEWFWNQ